MRSRRQMPRSHHTANHRNAGSMRHVTAHNTASSPPHHPTMRLTGLFLPLAIATTMPYTLLAGGYRSSIARLEFDGTTLAKVSDGPTPKDPSWVEGLDAERAFAISESEGLVLSLDVRAEVKVTSRAATHGNPAHGEYEHGLGGLDREAGLWAGVRGAGRSEASTYPSPHPRGQVGRRRVQLRRRQPHPPPHPGGRHPRPLGAVRPALPVRGGRAERGAAGREPRARRRRGPRRALRRRPRQRQGVRCAPGRRPPRDRRVDPVRAGLRAAALRREPRW